VARVEQQKARRLQWALLAGHLHLVTTLVLLEAVAAVNQVAASIAVAPVVEGVAHLGLVQQLVAVLEPLAVYLPAYILGQMVQLQILLTT
jgi:hypothetical protein